jgi:hypothetical protein
MIFTLTNFLFTCSMNASRVLVVLIVLALLTLIATIAICCYHFENSTRPTIAIVFCPLLTLWSRSVYKKYLTIQFLPQRKHNTSPLQRFSMILRVNSDYFLNQRQPADLCNGEALCFLCGTDWILKYYLDELRLQRVKSHYLTRRTKLKCEFWC